MSNILWIIFILLIIQHIVVCSVQEQNCSIYEQDCFADSSLKHITPNYNQMNEYNIIPIVTFMYLIGFF